MNRLTPFLVVTAFHLVSGGYCFSDNFFVVRPYNPNTPPPTPIADKSGFVTRPVSRDVIERLAEAKSTTKTKPKQSPSATKPIYRMEVMKSPVAGYTSYNVSGDWHPSYNKLFRHVVDDHSEYLPKEFTRDQYAQLTYDELWSIHSMIHCIEDGRMASRPLGRWSSVCPSDGSPCIHTWTWNIHPHGNSKSVSSPLLLRK